MTMAESLNIEPFRRIGKELPPLLSFQPVTVTETGQTLTVAA